MEPQLGKPTNIYYYFKIIFTNSLQATTPFTNTQFFQLQLEDAPTPCLPTTTGRRLRPPTGLQHVLAPPNHPYMIIQSLTYVHL